MEGLGEEDQGDGRTQKDLRCASAPRSLHGAPLRPSRFLAPVCARADVVPLAVEILSSPEPLDRVPLWPRTDAFQNATDAQRTYREVHFLLKMRGHPNIITLQHCIKAEYAQPRYRACS